MLVTNDLRLSDIFVCHLFGVFFLFVYMSGLVSPPMMRARLYPRSFLESGTLFSLNKSTTSIPGVPPIRLQRFFHLEKRGRKIHLGTPCWSGSTTLAVSATAFWQARSGFFRPQQKREEFDVLSATGHKVLGSLGFKT